MIQAELESYLQEHSSPEPRILKELDRETHLKALFPSMLSGHLQGRLLSLLSKMIEPELILEIGTFTGYSAICLAEGMKKEGELHTIDINDELSPFHEKYFKKTGKNIITHTGNALDIIPKLPIQFDLVFIDGDKREYPRYLEIVLHHIRKGGYIIADNTLWYGKVFQKNNDIDFYTRGIVEFNEMVKNNEHLEKVILPLRDGLSLIRYS
ncbi:MAG: O-methyltransferase [Bacteroidales bacterium]